MPRNETWVEAPQLAVFAVACDYNAYGRWGFGSGDVANADSSWPAPGSRFEYKQSFGVFFIHDTAEILEIDRPRRLVLEVRARPVTVARLEISMRGEYGRTHVVMAEHAVGGLLARLKNPALESLLYLRNGEALKRLKELAERRASSSGPPGSGLAD